MVSNGQATGGSSHYDVLIIGGGPGGSTTGSFLKKYNPALRVLILEKEKFPREHVGESQLPAISAVLHEMGAWDKVEAANFPIKVGATYRWGATKDLWDFEFVPLTRFKDEPRPASFDGIRRLTAFQVDRGVYDKILLDHAASLGCEVRECVQVTEVGREGDRVTQVRLSTGEAVTAKHYIDASGNAAVLRRAMGVGTFVPTKLKNIAIWDYWENAEWAVSVGVGGTRVQVMSQGHGWIWFIPLSPTRTSIGFITGAEYYQKCGKKPEELYSEAVKNDPRISKLVANATRENKVRTTKDWSFVSDRMSGENWFLVGESAGFADPILAGGLTLTHLSAREVAYIILAAEAGDHEMGWMKKHYTDSNRKRIMQYIRFADFWYASNGVFESLREYTSEIAKDAGLKMNAQEAFRWLSLGGFNDEDWHFPGLGGLDLPAVIEVTKIFSGQENVDWMMNKYNTFKLNLLGAQRSHVMYASNGKITKIPAYTRAGKTLPEYGMYGVVIEALKHTDNLTGLRDYLMHMVRTGRMAMFAASPPLFLQQGFVTLEGMLSDNWVVGSVDKKRPMTPFTHKKLESNIKWTKDVQLGDNARIADALKDDVAS